MKIFFDFENHLVYLKEHAANEKTCLLSGRKFGNRVIFEEICTCGNCEKCERYKDFYGQVHELEKQGVLFAETVRRIKKARQRDR